jgi:GAF domain-containing protein
MVTDSGSDLAARFAQFALDFRAEPSPERTIERVTESALAALGCSDGGVLLRSGGTVITAYASSRRVEISDQIQRESGEGPCFAASQTAELYRVNDTLLETPWPEWAHEVSKLGIRSALGVPLRTHDRNYGALNLYSEEPWAFDDDDVAVAAILARHAALAVDAATMEHSLSQAVDARKVIGQAQGIIMERYSVDADAAFDTLLRFSQNNNIKLRDLAAHIVSEREFPAP